MQLWGSALDRLSDHVPQAAVGQGYNILLVVIVRLHREPEQVEWLPAEQAHSSPSGPVLEAGKAEPVEAVSSTSPRQMGHWVHSAALSGPVSGSWLMLQSLTVKPLSSRSSLAPDTVFWQE